jgi:hypothetical protein
MEAWILRIKLEWNDGEQASIHRKEQQYSVWASEKIAQTECKNILLTNPNWFAWQPALYGAVECLLKSDNIQEAIMLINRYSETNDMPYGSAYRIHIEIHKSQFRGSVFE